MRGLAPGGKPWKEILRHWTDQVHLLVHGKRPSIPDTNWLFVARKLKQTKCSFWKSILGSWLNVRIGLASPNLHPMQRFSDSPFSTTLSSSTRLVSPWENVVSMKDAPLLILVAPKSKIFGTRKAGHGKASSPRNDLPRHQ